MGKAALLGTRLSQDDSVSVLCQQFLDNDPAARSAGPTLLQVLQKAGTPFHVGDDVRLSILWGKTQPVIRPDFQ